MTTKGSHFVGYSLRLQQGGKLGGGLFVRANSRNEALIQAKHTLTDEHGKGHKIVLVYWGRFGSQV